MFFDNWPSCTDWLDNVEEVVDDEVTTAAVVVAVVVEELLINDIDDLADCHSEISCLTLSDKTV